MPLTIPPFCRIPSTWPCTRSQTSLTTGSKMHFMEEAVIIMKPESRPAASSSGRPGKGMLT